MARSSTAKNTLSTRRVLTAQITNKFGEDVLNDPFERLFTKIERFSVSERRAVIAWCKKAMGSRSFLADERTRVLLAKILVALLPDSYSLIRSALCCQKKTYCRELQFSLFCYLDEVPTHSSLAEYKGQILKLIFDYLVSVKSDQASAAWMAGDLVGDHWDLNDATRFVRQAATIVRYPAGRMALAHAAAQIRERTGSDLKRESE